MGPVPWVTGDVDGNMSVSIRDARHSAADREWIQHAHNEYLNDLTRVNMNTGLFPVFGDFGDREPDIMARWFADDSSHALIILQNDRPVGFALVSRPPVNVRDEVDYRLAEFFITASARRLGIGGNAAALIFGRFAGRWEITEFTRNNAAVAFWRAVVGKYTGGRYRESVANGEVRQVFRSDNRERG